MKAGTFVIIEPTLVPRTLQGLPGKLLSNLKNISCVVGWITPETVETAVALYRCIVNDDLDPTDCLTVELVKTTKNANRDVQIVFANEIALIYDGVGGGV